MAVYETGRSIAILVNPIDSVRCLILLGKRVVEAVTLERTATPVASRNTSLYPRTDLRVAAGKFIQVVLDVDGRIVAHSDHHVEVGDDCLTQLLVAHDVDLRREWVDATHCESTERVAVHLQ